MSSAAVPHARSLWVRILDPLRTPASAKTKLGIR